ncbi:TIGR00159 family protein [Streptococcus pseudopneumoniae]|nr:ABC transporter permease [Streptococcus pseudopneumoniae 22725]MBF9677765.1 TIGR00159 family protein [Streptococcus pseudopneumoniae]MBF9683728.1 TIGR00159 family protein [Streptococcus pseudopneumoniae]NIB83027.1 TIGR00159 family protein [Streptococcus pseudopneumoniae]NIB96957.1 TIGR00159 family protein [Streptococcus pseudopneumoniae]
MNFQQLSNLQYWTSLFASPWTIAINLIDILIVAYILYHFTKAIAGTKIMILVRGVLVFILAQILANMIGLTTISWLINQIITYGVIAAVVIFSPEIRTGLERLGRATDFFSNAPISAEEQMIRAFVKSVEYMSPRKIGALVAIQRVRTLQEYISTGIPLDAKISAELLINIFIPNTPLHDGAVIIKEERIAVTSAYLPLTKNTGISKEFGTRHRAAIGLSEVSDALTFVVSEETGGISITYNGSFKHNLTLDEFETELREILLPKEEAGLSFKERLLGGWKHEKNSLYIISSLFFACVLFVYATATNFQNSTSARQVKTETYTNTVTNVPIDIRYNSDEYFISGFASEVSVVLTGANRLSLASEMQESTRKFKVTADLTDASVGTIEVPLSIEDLPNGLTAVATPQKITVKIGKKAQKDKVKVVPEIDPSQIDSRVQIENVTVSDEEVSITSDQETLDRIDKIIAVLPTSEHITGNYSGSVPLQAIDRNGVVLPTVITPFDTTMKVTTKPAAPSSSTSNSTTSSSSETSSSTKATSSKTN